MKKPLTVGQMAALADEIANDINSLRVRLNMLQMAAPLWDSEQPSIAHALGIVHRALMQAEIGIRREIAATEAHALAELLRSVGCALPVLP